MMLARALILAFVVILVVVGVKAIFTRRMIYKPQVEIRGREAIAVGAIFLFAAAWLLWALWGPLTQLGR